MPRFYVSHPVENFDKWKSLFDAHEGARAEPGLSTVGVYRKVGDENNVLVVLEGDAEAMKKFLASPELEEKMKEAGVLAHPETFSGEKL